MGTELIFASTGRYSVWANRPSEAEGEEDVEIVSIRKSGKHLTFQTPLAPTPLMDIWELNREVVQGLGQWEVT